MPRKRKQLQQKPAAPAKISKPRKPRKPRALGATFAINPSSLIFRKIKGPLSKPRQHSITHIQLGNDDDTAQLAASSFTVRGALYRCHTCNQAFHTINLNSVRTSTGCLFICDSCNEA
ncbi:hypothetical protein OAM67_01650 [bacterium]|nr:hypothetical protein [bacterium]